MDARHAIGANNPPHVIALSEAQSFAERCKALMVTDAETASQAALLIDEEVKARKSAEAARTSEKAPYLELGKAVDAAWKPVTETLVEGVAIIKARALKWQQAERARLAAEAEAARLAAEAAHEAAMKALEQAHKPESDFEAELDAELKVIEAEEAQAKADALPVATRQITAVGIRARSIRTVWSVKVTDEALMVKALADHPAVIAAAENVANQLVRLQKSALAIPGVQAVETEVL